MQICYEKWNTKKIQEGKLTGTEIGIPPILNYDKKKEQNTKYKRT